jgi:ribosomal protein S6
MWALTREINEYNQDGAYFVCIFDCRPTIQELKSVLKTENDATLEWIMQGGGRQNSEYEWYYLTQCNSMNHIRT